VNDLRAGTRLRILAVLVVAMFAALTTRLWFLQVLAAEELREEATNNAVRLVSLPAPRGFIKDSSGEVLVGNRMSLVLTINREDVADDREDVLYRLSQLLGVSASELGERMEDDDYFIYTPVPVAIDIPERVSAFVKEHNVDFPGVDVVELPVRTYPLGSAGAHVLGYLGEIDDDKLASPDFAGYRAGDRVGVTGAEAVFEHELIGTDGIAKYRVNSLGEDLGPIGVPQPSEPGNDVYLTLDADTQRLAEESLRLGIRHARTIFDPNSTRTFIANAGAVVVMDPDDGGIEAMASYPGFHPTAFTQRMSENEFERRFGAANGYPLLNRAMQGDYPPGSTYKPWIALSGLKRAREESREPIVTTTDTYGCPPVWTTPFDESDPAAIRYEFNNWTSANLGFMNVATALAKSCDTVFYPMGYEYWRLFYPPPWDDGIEGNDNLNAREPLQKDLTAIGFGRETNVDLPFEHEGRVPTAEWKRDIHRANPDAFPDGDWFPGDFVNMTIGQGDTLVTPLQLANAYSGLMNADGRVCTPHVLDRVLDPETGQEVRRYQPRCDRRLPFDVADVEYVRNALTGTVRPGGTAAGAFAGFPFEQVWLAGKTGTAEVDPKQDYSWFAAMTDSQGERHVIVVLVEQAGHGSTTAAPIARHIIEGLYGLEFSQFTELDLSGTDR
jgi:penicillin-binding protein 2